MKTKIIEQLEGYLSRIGVEFIKHEYPEALEFDVEAEEGNWTCSLLALDGSGFAIYSTIQQQIPMAERGEVALQLMQWNNQQLYGNFEMDLALGTVRFKTYVECAAHELAERMIERALLTNVSVMQKHISWLNVWLSPAAA